LRTKKLKNSKTKKLKYIYIMKETMNNVCALRKLMADKGISAFITPSTDPHSGEYVPKYWESRAWISGFTGSAGTAVVTSDKAALWTDSRYFLQAAEQIDGTDFVLMKDKVEGTPSVADWLGEVVPKGAVVAVDGWVNTVTAVEELSKDLEANGVTLVTDFAPYDEIWTGRPVLPLDEVFIQPMEYAGESASSKIERIRTEISKWGADAILVSMLDEVAWTLNLRGSDIEYNPVFVSYLFITEKDAVLYVNKSKINAEVAAYLEGEGVAIKGYNEIEGDLRNSECKVMIQKDKTNAHIAECIATKVVHDCPVSTMKIMKNEAEIRGYRSAMLKDGLAMVKWIKWAIPAVEAGGQTELSLDEKLYQCRAEQDLFKGVSFASIMGYAAHGAIVHYEPTPETDIPVEPKGLLLIDSGAQYQDGTTDITRTIPLGPLTWEERRDYTLVLRGFINLGRAVFPRGTYGSQLDCLARTPMWRYGLNYLHGTGHGVGSFMNVHEGPHQFRMNYMPTPLVPGMTITVEPGIYIEGQHGVRHENTTLVVEADFSDKGMEGNQGQTFGPYYTFEHLTLCPILTSPILVEMMEKEEIEWFNKYQQMVYDKLSAHLDEEHRQWLYEVTRPIG
jgi:Xaa-Pro aminopeptidase